MGMKTKRRCVDVSVVDRIYHDALRIATDELFGPSVPGERQQIEERLSAALKKAKDEAMIRSFMVVLS